LSVERLQGRKYFFRESSRRKQREGVGGGREGGGRGGRGEGEGGI